MGGTDEAEYNRFDISKGKIAASGNIMFLMDKIGELKDLSSKDYCYSNMFFGCSSLTQAPVLPAETLAYGCYWRMFFGCSSLTQAPALPAETLAYICYSEMFYGCTSLTNAYFPNLDSDTVIDEVVGNQEAFYGAASNIETECLDRTIIINSTAV
jgi:hypothetical protein